MLVLGRIYLESIRGWLLLHERRRIAFDQFYYREMVKLLKGLKSTYKHNFIFKTEMVGSAEIVTADLRLIERVFYGFRKLLM
jgi:hypothetical protein